MSRFLKLAVKIIILGCFIVGCSSRPPQVPANIPTVDLTPLTAGILVSEEIHASNFLKVDERRSRDGLILTSKMA